jgi:predicted SPOUT superfamily RNA methylase MTH1
MSRYTAVFCRRRSNKISVAIPASLVRDVPHLREKTSKIGMIGRAASIFRIDEIIIYFDSMDINQRKEGRLINLILNYLETPQYLRKHLFKLNPDLKYVGILPPLRTPHHLVARNVEEVRSGDIRDGVIIKTDSKSSLTDVGLSKLVTVRASLNKGSRTPLKIQKVDKKIFAEPIRKEAIELYWGYRVIFPKLTLRKVIESVDYDLVIATSKYGKNVNKVLDEIRNKWSESHKALIIFGSPTQGIDEILAQENVNTEEITNFRINAIQDQGVETIRTEEAIFASLSILNLFN